MAGETGRLKERTLGIEIFERDPLYDTNVDPIVRVTAGEVRKRLAQYYCQPDHLHEVHINLPTGTYIPEFQAVDSDSSLAAPAEPSYKEPSQQTSGAAKEPPAASDTQKTAAFRAGPPAITYLAVAFALIVGILLGVGYNHFHQRSVSVRQSPLDTFWAPVLHSHATVMLCVGQVYAQQIALKPDRARDPASIPVDISTKLSASFPALPPEDAATMARVGAYLRSRSMKFAIREAANTTFANLAASPAVLIGAFDNDWTIRLTDPLRFHFEMDPHTKQEWIANRNDPGKKIGTHIPGQSFEKMTESYGLISRLHDPSTGRLVVMIAGVSPYGTAAAGKFVSDSADFGVYVKQAPTGWANKNLQILIVSKIVDGSPGPPRVAETYAW